MFVTVYWPVNKSDEHTWQQKKKLQFTTRGTKKEKEKQEVISFIRGQSIITSSLSLSTSGLTIPLLGHTKHADLWKNNCTYIFFQRKFENLSFRADGR